MRLTLYALLLSSTALCNVPNHAGAAPALPALVGIGAAVAGSAAAGLVSGAVLSAVVGGVVATGVTFLGQSVLSSGKRNLASSQAQTQAQATINRLANYAQAVTYWEWAFGRVRKGGPLAFSEATDSTDIVAGNTGPKRHYAVILAGHQIEGVVQRYSDQRQVSVDGNGLVTNTGTAGFVRIRDYLGSSSQAADAELVSSFPEWTSAHDMTGLAYLAAWARNVAPDEPFSEIYPGGREPVLTAIIDGWNEIFDPRSSTTGFTANAALVTAHVLTAIWGQSVDWDDVAEEADASDFKWEINGTLSADQTFEQMRVALMSACDGFSFEKADGTVGFYVGRWMAPEITLTQADFEELEVSEGVRDGQSPTEVSAIYTEPANEYTRPESGAFVFDAGANSYREQIDLPLVSSHTQASRINKRTGHKLRARYSLRGVIGRVGHELWAGRDGKPHRIIEINSPLVPWNLFEVETLRHVGLGRFEIEARSTRETEWYFTSAVEEPASPVRSSATSSVTIPIIDGVAAAAVGEGSFEVTWNAQPSYLGQQVRFRRQGETAWQIYDVPAGQNFARITGQAVTGATATIEVQARNRTRGFRFSDWQPSTETVIDVVSNTVPPDALDAFAANLSGSDIAVSFTAPSDAGFQGVRIYRADYAVGYTDPPVFADAALVATRYANPGASSAWTDEAPGVGFYAYWADTFNSSGVSDSANRSGPETAEITS